MGFYHEKWRKAWDFTILKRGDLMQGNGDISTQTSVDRGTMVHD